MDEENNNEQQQQSSKLAEAKQSLDSARGFRRAISSKKAENVAKIAAKKTRLSNVAGKLTGFIKPLGFIILVIILTIGIIAFILTGFGLIWGGISGAIEDIADWWKSIKVGSEEIVKAETIQDTMNYLYGLDYDLYGYGFVTKPAKNAEDR